MGRARPELRDLDVDGLRAQLELLFEAVLVHRDVAELRELVGERLARALDSSDGAISNSLISPCSSSALSQRSPSAVYASGAARRKSA